MSETSTEPMSKDEALRWLVERSPVTVGSYREIGDVFGWDKTKSWRVIQGWKRLGYITTETTPNDGRMQIAIVPTAIPISIADDDVNDTERGTSAPLPSVSEQHPQRVAAVETNAPWQRQQQRPETVYAAYVPSAHGGGGFDAVESFRHASTAERLLILVAAGLSATAAYMSVTGMVVMYPAEPVVIMVFGALIEVAKFVGFGVLAANWKVYGFIPRWAAVLLLLVAAVINASGVYGKLIANHAGPAASRAASYTEKDGDEGAKLEVASDRLSDIDRRIKLIDDAAEGAARRGRANTAVNVMREQQKARAALVQEREKAAQEVARLKAGRNGMAARHREDEAATMPVRHAAALFEDFGLVKPGTDPEKLIRWLSFMLLVAGDPLALALMVAVNSRTRWRAA